MLRNVIYPFFLSCNFVRAIAILSRGLVKYTSATKNNCCLVKNMCAITLNFNKIIFYVIGANLEDQSVSSNPLTTKELSQNKSDVSQSDNSTTAKPPLPTTVKPIPSTTANPPPPPTTISPITTAVPSTTTAAPDVHPGVWNVSTNGTNCILAKMAIDFSVNYNDTNNKVFKFNT